VVKGGVNVKFSTLIRVKIHSEMKLALASLFEDCVTWLSKHYTLAETF